MPKPFFSTDDLLVNELCICGQRDLSRVNENITLCMGCHITVSMIVRCIEATGKPVTEELFWNTRMEDMHNVVSRDTYLAKAHIIEVRTKHTITALKLLKDHKSTGLLDMFWDSYLEYKKKNED